MDGKADYGARRKDFLERFARCVRDERSIESFSSPSGRYRLETWCYEQPDTRWAYSRGVVTEIANGRVVADIKRNFGHFWHAWIRKADGREYLLCGEDYQGYSIIEPATGGNCVEFGNDGYEGRGFCWASVQPSPDGNVLVVEGCYWACPYELVFFDFTDPSVLPLPELFRVLDDNMPGEWVGNDEYRYKVAPPSDDEERDPPMADAVWHRPKAGTERG